MAGARKQPRVLPSRVAHHRPAVIGRKAQHPIIAVKGSKRSSPGAGRRCSPPPRVGAPFGHPLGAARRGVAAAVHHAEAPVRARRVGRGDVRAGHAGTVLEPVRELRDLVPSPGVAREVHRQHRARRVPRRRPAGATASGASGLSGAASRPSNPPAPLVNRRAADRGRPPTPFTGPDRAESRSPPQRVHDRTEPGRPSAAAPSGSRADLPAAVSSGARRRPPRRT